VAVDAHGKIYVASGTIYQSSVVSTYTANGKPTTPSILAGMNASADGVAVDAAGKIYVTQSGGSATNGALTTYTSKGTPSTPTITGLNFPYGVAIH
jgi:sugar lactone lactonase YvrE